MHQLLRCLNSSLGNNSNVDELLVMYQLAYKAVLTRDGGGEFGVTIIETELFLSSEEFIISKISIFVNELQRKLKGSGNDSYQNNLKMYGKLKLSRHYDIYIHICL